MTDCLHCEINDLVQQRIKEGETDLGELAAMMVESLADLILLAPEHSQATLMAHALTAFGSCSWRKPAQRKAGRTPLTDRPNYSLDPLRPFSSRTRSVRSWCAKSSCFTLGDTSADLLPKLVLTVSIFLSSA